MADAPLLAMDVLQWARHHRCFPGQGQFDLESFFEQVLRAGYAGPLSLEIFNDLFRETPNRRTATDAMRSLLYLESQVRARLERERGPRRRARRRRAARAHRAVRSAGGAAPGRLRVPRIRASTSGRRRSAGCSSRLGFACAGRHRTKAVALYRQGGISLVVNAEPDSFARARFDAHGPSVCAIGLATPEPGRRPTARGALLSARFESPRGPHELQMPAIVAPGGSHRPLRAARPRGAALDAVDFVAEPDAPADADAGPASRSTTSRSVCRRTSSTPGSCSAAPCSGCSRGDSLELADPFGLIRSSGIAERGAQRALRPQRIAAASARAPRAR